VGLFGGRSGEHEVSLASAASVIRVWIRINMKRCRLAFRKKPLADWSAAQKLLRRTEGGRRVVMAADPTERH